MIAEFYDAVDSLNNRDEVRLFLKSLLSFEEIAMLMRRIEIAILLSAKFKYNEITKMLGVGNDKISNVQRSMQQDDDGYKIIIKRLVENRKRRLKKMKDIEKRGEESMNPLNNLKRYRRGASLLPDLLDAVIEKFENNEELEKEAFLFTPSFNKFK